MCKQISPALGLTRKQQAEKKSEEDRLRFNIMGQSQCFATGKLSLALALFAVVLIIFFTGTSFEVQHLPNLFCLVCYGGSSKNGMALGAHCAL